ncbi:glutamine synthetase [Pseudovirgaria hyperparasitica]|uniref:Glutamine synthetase n=1 Tax=Pseudovirgaria hyperparasitica TaxID=470096 RepID=A0A6A6VT87_9PEZI|nr:glutamine synthetase [Pseudovirgaria hyperparasitica]KAF2753099.1 glutamine synthetase [Pseudovirgaria hyperparasitica]
MSRQDDVNFLETFFNRHQSISIVQLNWTDYSGVVRTRFVPHQRALDLANGSSYYLAQNCMIIPIATAPKCWTEQPERWNLCPDWSSIRICGYNQKHAFVMCCVDQVGPEKRFSQCPRKLLQKTIEDFAGVGMGKILVGFEIEFVLLDENDNLYKPMDRVVGYSRTKGLRGKTLDLLEEVLDALSVSGIQVHHFHTEIDDQVEIALSPLDPVAAIDTLLLAQETIRTIFSRHNLKATMAPKPLLQGTHNGCHMHLSFSEDASLVQHFVAGVLTKLHSLCAIGMANYDGYVRSEHDEAGVYIGWGTENREFPIRKVDDTHWEYRFMDFTANLYLFAATLFLSGKKGIQDRIDLKWKDCQVYPEPLGPRERFVEYGITDSMPVSLQTALLSYTSDEDLRAWLGDGMFSQYADVKQKEVEHFGVMAEEERRKKFVEYF